MRDRPFLFFREYQPPIGTLLRHLFRKEGLFIIQDQNINHEMQSIYNQCITYPPPLSKGTQQFFSFPNVMQTARKKTGDSDAVSQESVCESNEKIESQYHLLIESRVLMTWWNSFVSAQQRDLNAAYARQVVSNEHTPIHAFQINYASLSLFIGYCHS